MGTLVNKAFKVLHKSNPEGEAQTAIFLENNKTVFLYLNTENTPSLHISSITQEALLKAWNLVEELDFYKTMIDFYNLKIFKVESRIAEHQNKLDKLVKKKKRFIKKYGNNQ